MDVSGKNPTSETGRYFRNNVWWWPPLWGYCCEIGNAFISDKIARGCHSNDGRGLDKRYSTKLAKLLQAEIDSGRCLRRQQEFAAENAAVPDENCPMCWNRTPKKKTCTQCSHKGKIRPISTWYSFSVENVQEFANFLKDSGGFMVW